MDSPLSDEELLQMYRLIDPDNMDKHRLTLKAKSLGMELTSLCSTISTALQCSFSNNRVAWALMNDMQVMADFDSYRAKHPHL